MFQNSFPNQLDAANLIKRLTFKANLYILEFKICDQTTLNVAIKLHNVTENTKFKRYSKYDININ